uniref:Glucose-6-phosphate isomerase n=1 Tax=Nephromyces sp. MMRI TaxID=2496275 RepID=A0A3S8V374_9APIC|nr:glucose-6-phosphate isomerase [Nephromyces sp. MMRI]AZL94534.1 glucose-6-phosphate isomerase [Nephromyces sp. MMRI]
MDQKFWYECNSIKNLQNDANLMKNTKIADLIEQNSNSGQFDAQFNDIYFDFCRQKINTSVLNHLFEFADERNVVKKIRDMFEGEIVNITEKRAALHTLLRYPYTQNNIKNYTQNDIKNYTQNQQNIYKKQQNNIQNVHSVLNQIQLFSQQIRQGEFCGYFGDKFEYIICVGIGGSFLATQFVFEALLANQNAYKLSNNFNLMFLSNVDPINFTQITQKVNPKKTLVIIISKTFTTAETMLNAQLMKEWLIEQLGNSDVIEKHMIAVSTNSDLVQNFGINLKNMFGFWDWVGGRFSVTSAVGILPLSIVFGFDFINQFLNGCYDMDMHFLNTSINKNIPILMALISFWNSSFFNLNAVAILPYCQALHKFCGHIQQLIMESNGKCTSTFGGILDKKTSEIYFGEPGTNGQHSFYQLIHQGQVIQTEFIGFIVPPLQISAKNSEITAHDELMCNFFAQPDALAFGKTAETCLAEGIADWLVPHCMFTGNRPSSILLLPELSPYYLGCLLSLYEHRTVTQAFIWGINPFDQYGVQLGKVAAGEVRKYLENTKGNSVTKKNVKPFCSSTQKLLNTYLKY